MTDLHEQLVSNLGSIQDRIAAAAQRSGRDAGDVSLVAVCKYVSSRLTAALVNAGCLAVGENRPQQLWDKREALAETPVQWHMIGNLQRNKVKRTIESLALLHSGDSLRLLSTVNDAAAAASLRLPVLLQVNISREPNKHGFASEEMALALPEVAAMEHLDVRGLMTMATLGGGSDQARGDFARLRELRDTLQAECPESISLDELSMGMSGDFEAAIEEGATLVRVGSALFEGISRD
ncbi:MAG: YggS family pyridoxal phosphate-dependent enzyme [Pirellulaceae bacterium]